MPKKAAIVRRLVSRKKILFHHSFPLILFWTPKSGCTSLAKWFFYHIKYPRKYDWIHQDRVEYIKRNNYQSSLTTQLLKGEKQTWKLVRNPYQRAVSSFLHTVLHKKKLGVSLPDENIAFKPYLYWVKKQLNRQGAINPHIDPQYMEGEEAIIRHYLYLERFNQQIRKLEKKHGLRPSPLSSITKSPHHRSNNMIQKGAFSEVPFSREYILRGGKLPTIESFYDSETRQLVKEIYQKDFVVYQYPKNGSMRRLRY